MLVIMDLSRRPSKAKIFMLIRKKYMFHHDPIKLIDLPIELLFEIYSYLSPEQAAMARVNRASNKIIEYNLFWKQKYQRHFPQYYEVLSHKNDVNWYVEFRKT